MEDKLITFYPGVYTDEEKAAIERYKRGEMPLLFEGLIRVPPMDDWTIKLFAKCWDRFNPLWVDSEYAKNAGYRDIPAMPGYLSVEVRGTFPDELGDLGKPDGTTFVGDGYDHEDLYFKPVYPGDKLSLKVTKHDLVDVTPAEGSKKRCLIMISEAELYDESGDIVSRHVRRWPESLTKSTDPNAPKPPKPGEGGPSQAPEGAPPAQGQGGPPPMMGGGYQHPAHKYTDEDYELMKKLWSEEKIRGAETLYWEDVNIGDELTPVCDPPQYGAVIHSNMYFWDTFRFGSDGLREALMEGGRTGRLGAGGLYSSENRHAGVGGVASLYNYHGKLLATRCLTNWCGDEGFVIKLGWRFVNDAKPEEQFNHFPAGFYRPSELLKVPYMKDRYANTHGMGYDAYITRGYVYDKYVLSEGEHGDDGGHYADIILWVEDFDGNIEQECPATVRLKSRG